MNERVRALKVQYDTDAYLVVEDIIPPTLLARLQQETRSAIDRVAAGTLDHELLDTFENADGVPQLRRIASPEAFASCFDEAMRLPALLDLVQVLLGGSVRFDHGKLNFKPPSGGAAVEWHQDWAFYPQTNDDMLAVGILLEDCTLESGPLMVVPGSHTGAVHDHHHNGYFVGGVNAEDIRDEIQRAVPLTATAGSISVHHVRTLHASTANRSAVNRPLLLFNYVAVDAFPVFHSFNWDDFNERILRGEITHTARVCEAPVRIPSPTPKPADEYATGSLFDLQTGMAGALYAN
ncbi:MAG: phytanoyl-CoA dioxygenase family protein [Pseudomonadota bacterium]